MKKKLLMLIIVFSLVFSAMITASAADMTHNVGQQYVAYTKTSPTFDGVVNADEWKAAYKFTINDTNSKAAWNAGFAEVPTDQSIDVYMLWDEKYLYVGYDVTDPTACYFHEFEFDGGDNIWLWLDLGPCLAGMTLADSVQIGGNAGPRFAAAPQIKNDGTLGEALYCHQAVINESIITDREYAPFAASLTEYGWMYEYGIPWELLISDMLDKCGESIEKVTAGTELTANITYSDYNNRTQVNWYSTTKTGYESPLVFDPDEHGIFLKLLGEGEDAPETTPFDDTSVPDITTDMTDTADNATDIPDTETADAATDKKENTTAITDRPTDTAPAGNADGNNNILWILIAAVVVVIAAAVTLIVKKKKK